MIQDRPWSRKHTCSVKVAIAVSKKRYFLVQSKLQNTRNYFMLLFCYTEHILVPQWCFIFCFKGRHCWLSDYYWYCNKLKPEPWCWWQLKEGGVWIYSASQLFPSSSWIFHGEIISFLAQTLLDLPTERRCVFILKAVMFKDTQQTETNQGTFQIVSCKLRIRKRERNKQYCLAVYL